MSNIRGELLYGHHSCACALSAGYRKIHRAFLMNLEDNKIRKCNSHLPSFNFLQELKAKNIPTVRADRDVLHNILRTGTQQTKGQRQISVDHIQGIVLDVSPLLIDFIHPSNISLPENKKDIILNQQDIDIWSGKEKEIKNNNKRLLVVLDNISDPQNVGAILRSALLLDANGIILTAKGCAPLNATVSRTSSGALELLVANNSLRYTSNIITTLTMYKELGWRIIGATAEQSKNNKNNISTTFLSASQLKRDKDTILVLGSEGYGLHQNIINICDMTVGIPLIENKSNLVDSLNVGSAASILFWQLRPMI